jgi:hypothetical protein
LKQENKSQAVKRNSIPLCAIELFRNITDVIRRSQRGNNRDSNRSDKEELRQSTLQKRFFIRSLQLISDNAMTRAIRSPQPSNLLFVSSQSDTKNNASVTMLFLSSFHPDEAFSSLPHHPGSFCALPPCVV